MYTLENYEEKVKEYIKWYWPLKKQYGLISKEDILSKVGTGAQKELENWEKELNAMQESLKLTSQEAGVIYNGLVVAHVTLK